MDGAHVLRPKRLGEVWRQTREVAAWPTGLRAQISTCLLTYLLTWATELRAQVSTCLLAYLLTYLLTWATGLRAQVSEQVRTYVGE